MNIEYLRNFVVIVDCGNILKASKKLFIAQPSLSNQVKYLEEEYGSTLIIRGKNLKLTESGKVLYDKAKAIINALDSSYTEIENIRDGNMGSINIAIPPTVYKDLVNNNFCSFISKYPNIILNIFEVNSKDALKKIKEGEVELAITNAYIEKTDEYDYYDLGLEKYQVFVFDESDLKNKRELCISDLEGENIVLPRAYIDDLKSICVNESVSYNLVATTTSSMGAIELARLKKALAIVPLPNDEKVISELNMIPLIYESTTRYTRKLVYRKNKELTSASKLFIDCLISAK